MFKENLNVKKIREDFPILKRIINGNNIIYLDIPDGLLEII